MTSAASTSVVQDDMSMNAPSTSNKMINNVPSQLQQQQPVGPQLPEQSPIRESLTLEQQQMAIQQQLISQQQLLLNKVEHIFEWSFGGENVEICAEFNNWQGEKMEKVVSGEVQKIGTGLTQPQGQNMGQQPATHRFAKLLDGKRYEYKFRVDGNWRYAPDQSITRDQRGNENNVVDLTTSKTLMVLLQEQQYLSSTNPLQQ